jgi:hypothetical protein
MNPTVFSKLEESGFSSARTLLKWSQPGNVGNDSGASSKPHGNFSWFPSVPDLVTISPAGAFDDYFFLLDFPIPEVIPSNFVVGFDDYSVLPEDVNSVQALEFQIELRDGAYVYNMAYQFDQASKSVRVFNFTKSVWLVTSVPYPDLSLPLKIAAEFRIDRVFNTTTHDVLWLNGQKFTVGVTQAATPAAGTPELSCSFQLDSNSKGAPYTAIIRNMRVAWL